MSLKDETEALGLLDIPDLACELLTKVIVSDLADEIFNLRHVSEFRVCRSTPAPIVEQLTITPEPRGGERIVYRDALVHRGALTALDPDQWGEALKAMLAFAAQGDLGSRVAALESGLRGVPVEDVEEVRLRHNASGEALQGALTVKGLAGQVNVTIHALGIVTALPYILEPGEIIEDVSLGAGNTGRSFDLETDRRVAEFKFIRWRGGAESIRQKGVFIDLLRLAESKTDKKKVLYLTGLEHPLRFLNGARNLNSVLSRNSAVHDRFRTIHGEQSTVVRQYWNHVSDRVDLVDLLKIVPPLQRAWLIND